MRDQVALHEKNYENQASKASISNTYFTYSSSPKTVSESQRTYELKT